MAWARLAVAVLCAAWLSGSPGAYAQGVGPLVEETFQSVRVGDDGALDSALGRFVVEGEGTLEIMQPPRWGAGELALRLPGGTRERSVLEITSGLASGGTLQFVCQRSGRKKPFELRAVLVDREGGETVHELADKVNAKERHTIALPVPPGLAMVRFEVTAPAARGVWIDDLRLLPPAEMVVESVRFLPATRPLVNGESVEIGTLEFVTSGTLAPLEIDEVRVSEVVTQHGTASVEEIADELSSARCMKGTGELVLGEAGRAGVLGVGRTRVPVTIDVDLAGAARLGEVSARHAVEVSLGGTIYTPQLEVPARDAWPAVRLTPAGQAASSVSLVTALKHGDRGEALVCAVSVEGGGVLAFRSVDGGVRWAALKLPPSGTSSDGSEAATAASLVYDMLEHQVHLIVQRGDSLESTLSPDGGSTWSPWKPMEPASPKRLRAAGTTGICMSTGTLAVPVIVRGGFRIADEDCAGLIVSEDHGATWSMHHAAYPNTTTSAVVEVGPGVILLNMTDGRGALRSERTTPDLGRMWRARPAVSKLDLHRSAGSDGALIHLGRARGEGWDGRMVLANAETEKRPVRNLLLKGSSDNASHWPAEYQLVLDDGVGVDHPSLAPVGKAEIGVAYECSRGGVVFQRLPESVVVPKVVSWFDVTGGR